MTEIKIKRLALDNFKCHKHLELVFDGGDASVYGDNASGKTSIYDALTWLLFGKDSRGNGEKSIEIKPLDANGEVRDHLAVTAVEAVLDVNGEEVCLRRTLQEVWSAKRGSGEASFEGNTSEYFVDGVPCRKHAFTEKVNSLVDEDTFRLLTGVSHFAAGISWQERREVLFRLAGVMDDARILATDGRFRPLADAMGKLLPEDFKKKLLAEKRKLVGSGTEIPARISECEKTIEDIERLDFAAAKREAEALTAQKDALSRQLLDIDRSSEAEKRALQLRQAQLELSALEAENRAFRASQSPDSGNVHMLTAQLSELQGSLTRKKRSLEAESGYIAQLDGQISEARNQWLAVNGEGFTGSICPTCGQELPAEQRKAAAEQFETQKQKRLAKLLDTVNTAREAKAMAEERFDRGQEEVLQLDSELCDLRERLAAAEKKQAEPKDMEGYAQRRSALEAKLQSLSEAPADQTADGKEALRRQLTEVSARLEACMTLISRESLLDYSRQRVQQLRADADRAAARLEGIESMLWLLEEFSRYKTRFVEDSVNGLFRIARFRLFREQVGGGVEDRCDVVYDGVPYISVNSGMKINLGIDIINTLSAARGVRVPLFVDNAECVTRLEKCGSQIIRLVVSDRDPVLRVEQD